MKIENLLPESSPLRKMLETRYLDVTSTGRFENSSDIIHSLGKGIVNVAPCCGKSVIPCIFPLTGEGPSKEEALEMLKNKYFENIRALIGTISFPKNCIPENYKLLQLIRQDVEFYNLEDIIYGEGFYCEAKLALILLKNK